MSIESDVGKPGLIDLKSPTRIANCPKISNLTSRPSGICFEAVNDVRPVRGSGVFRDSEH